MIKVLSLPHLDLMDDDKESGVHTVIREYFKYGPQYDLEFVAPDATSYDLLATHPGITGLPGDVAHLHGLYFTGDFPPEHWQHQSNKMALDGLRAAKLVTVPSAWVGEIFQRDMRFTPEVLPHGVDWEAWQHDYEPGNYVLGYAKNRAGQDVCDPSYLSALARKFPRLEFKSTFYPDGAPNNVTVTDVLPYAEMKALTQQSAVFVQAVKETFGLHALEAVAAGVPVVAYNHGGAIDFVEHGVNGYLAKPGDLEDLAAGLAYCLQYRDKLGRNGRELAKLWTWEQAVKQLAEIYRRSLVSPEPKTAVIVPIYNKQATLERAVQSVLVQTRPPTQIILIDDGSTDESGVIGQRLAAEYPTVEYHYQANAGVAVARNAGVALSDAQYICCLDADDQIAPMFLEACLDALEADPALHLAYTALQWVKPDGSTGVSDWPSAWDFDAQLTRKNQVPTCGVFRKETFERLGGYRKRYAPTGCGSEDAALWTQFGLHGYKCQQVTDEPLFTYSFLSGQTAQEGYHEVDWLALYPAVYDHIQPFASYATPENGIAHPVYMYDEPLISVIIPIGPGHLDQVTDALDSVESQRGFRKWEIIAVNDSGEPLPEALTKAYPFVKWAVTEGSRGAGYARNRGAAFSRGEFLVFLDADDMLMPDFMQAVLQKWDRQSTPAIVYTDYLGSAFIDEQEAENQKALGKLRSYGGPDKLSVMGYPSIEPQRDFDCEAAQAMPRFPIYHWCLVTCLIPKAWHNEIGGFDEQMESWEDVDYHWRLAWAGKCYVRIAAELILYRFASGHRRLTASADTEQGRQIGRKLLKYIDQKKEQITMSPCAGCGGNRAAPMRAVDPQATKTPQAIPTDGSESVLVFYIPPKRGDHRYIGGHVFAERVPGFTNIRSSGGYRIDYGYHSSGEAHPFKVHALDIQANPGYFARAQKIKEAPPVARPQPQEPQSVNVQTQAPAVANLATPITTPPPPRIPDDEPFDMQTIPGITMSIARQLEANGWTTADDLKSMTIADWQAIKGIAEVKAEMIMDYLKEL